MSSTVIDLLREYENSASIKDLKDLVKSDQLKILWEFNSSDTQTYFNSIIDIFNIKKIWYCNQLTQIKKDDVDAVFILCPYDRVDRINVVRWGIKNKKPIYVLEAGFVSSIYPLGSKEAPISFHVDSTGSLYLDGDGCNEVVNLLNSPEDISSREKNELEKLRKLITTNGISKYNFSKKRKSKKIKSKVLVIDQTKNDFSIHLAGANEGTFNSMMDMAIANHPFESISIKVHPEVLLGIREGNIDIEKYRNKENIHILSESLSPKDLFEGVEHVYTVSSTLGFEALLYGKKVHLFGKSFFGGWGLTIDYVEYNNRQRTRSIYDLMYAIYIHSTFYKDICSDGPANAFIAIENFNKLITSYRSAANYAEYQTKNLKNQIEVLNKELKILQDQLRNYGKKQQNAISKFLSENSSAKKTDKANSSSVMLSQQIARTKEYSSARKNHHPKLELIFMLLVIKDEKKLRKYLRDRELFFEDSSNFFLRKYWNLFGKTKENRN